MTFLSDVLRTSKIDVDSIAVLLHDFSWNQQLFWVVGAELDDEWPVDGGVTFFPGDEIKILLAIGFVACINKYLP